MSEEGYEYDFYKRNLDIQKGEFMIRNSYNFENDRASITQYLSTKNSGSKESYNKITKENLRNRSYIDKDFTYSDCFKIISS